MRRRGKDVVHVFGGEIKRRASKEKLFSVKWNLARRQMIKRKSWVEIRWDSFCVEQYGECGSFVCRTRLSIIPSLVFLEPIAGRYATLGDLRMKMQNHPSVPSILQLSIPFTGYSEIVITELLPAISMITPLRVPESSHRFLVHPVFFTRGLAAIPRLIFDIFSYRRFNLNPTLKELELFRENLLSFPPRSNFKFLHGII